MVLAGRYRVPSKGKSIQRFGRTMMGAGAGLIEQATMDEYNSQMTRFKAESLEEENNLDAWLNKNTNNPETWESGYFEKEFWPNYEAKAKEGKSGKALEEIIKKLPWKKQLFISHIRNRRNEQSRINALAAKDVFAKRISNTDAEDGKQLAETSNEVLEMLENIRRSGADPKIQTEEAVYENADIIMSPALMRFLVNNPHKLNEDGTIAEGGEDYWINHPNEFADEFGINSELGRQILNAEEKVKLRRDYEARNSISKAKVKAMQDADKQDILDRFLAKQFEADPEKGIDDDIFGFINKTSLEPDEKEIWMNKARNWAKIQGKEIKSDVREEARLERKALDISTGAVKREDFIKEVTEAAFGDKPKIDEDAFDSLMTTANREHKTYQANAMGEAINYGLRQLTHTEEQMNLMMFSPEFAGLTTEQKTKQILALKRLEEERFSQFKRAMNEWFQAEKAAGREPDDDDIYVKSRKLTTLYRAIELSEDIYKGTPEERERINRIASYFTAPRPATPSEFIGQEGKSPYKEYPDAFLEAGVWKVIRNGKKYRIVE